MTAARLAALLPAGLARRLARAFIGVVAAALAVNGAIGMWLSYEEATASAVGVQREKAAAAAERVGQFIGEIENQIGWTTRAEWARVGVDQRRYDFIRLLRQSPAITEALHIDGQGKEQLRLSRLEPDVMGSGADLSGDPRFARAVAERVWHGPVYFRRGSEPYMTLSVAHAGRTPGVTSVGVNLKLVWDVIAAIRVGEQGYAYVTDAAGRLIAHPDMSLVLRETDLSRLPQVAEAAQAAKGGAGGAPQTVPGPDGRMVLSAWAPIPKLGWLVFVELPRREVLAPVLASLAQTLALLGLGVLLALFLGSWLAGRLAAPIRALEAGAQRLGEGDLAQRVAVSSSDEIGRLAGRFNVMAGRIQESQETLERRVEERTRELTDSLDQQTATANVLKVISRSAFDLQKVLPTLLETGVRLCGGARGIIFLRRGDFLEVAAHSSTTPEEVLSLLRQKPLAADLSNRTGRALVTKSIVHFSSDDYDERYPRLDAQKASGYKSVLSVPLVTKDDAIGVLNIAKTEVGSFTPRQIELAKTFADQAVIAIENARLFEEVQARTAELQQSLDYQTATGDILGVIASSPTDVQPVLDSMAETACRLCDATDAIITLVDGGDLAIHAHHGPIALDFQRKAISGDWFTGRAVLDGRQIHVRDAAADDPDFPEGREMALRLSYHTTLATPLMRDGAAIGAISIRRTEIRPFSPQQMKLVETFADQAVIAIANTRLFAEVQARTAELTESLEYQTAISDVLAVISRSPNELRPVLQCIAETAARLCEGFDATLFLREGNDLRVGAHEGTIPLDFGAKPITPDWITGCAVLRRAPVHVHDFAEARDEFPEGYELHRRHGHRTGLAIPLLRSDEAIGAFMIRRLEVRPFTEKQIAVLQTFADQAVIAINNVRLFAEVQARTAELQESLVYQTGSASILRVIAASPTDVGPVLNAIVESACEVCDAYDAAVLLRQGDALRFSAHRGPVPIGLEQWPINRRWTAGRAVLDKAPVHVADLQGPEGEEFTDGRELSLRMGHRAILSVPLLREKEAIGAIVLRRVEPLPFSDKQIDLLKTFADQAVIAIGNVRLFDEVQARTKELQQSLDDLSAAQDRLIQTEKLASLGQLTAGIAHEIKNPLNFVNNFSELSVELVGELEDALARAGGALDPALKSETAEIAAMLKGNLAKVVTHGKRADSIVKNMLAHSREGGGEKRVVDLNATVDEALNLAYHGARAEKPGFNIALERDYDPGVGSFELYPQEFTRVLLNLIGNGFHAAHQRSQKAGANGFEPTLKVSTAATPQAVEIRVRDNGAGIPKAVKDRIFEPFFTTKPAGEGTGLGLSLSHDIVVKQHGGSIDVATEPGAFTEFTITLPRRQAETRRTS